MQFETEIISSAVTLPMKIEMEFATAEKPVVLVTGSGGFIGAKFVTAAAAHYRVVGLDINPPASEVEGTEWIACDFTQEESVRQALDVVHFDDGEKMDIAFHFERDHFVDSHFADRFGLAAKPTAFFQKRLQDLSLKHPHFLIVCKDLFPGHVSLKKLQFIRAARLVFLFRSIDLKPEISVRAHGDGIFRPLDTPELILTEYFGDVTIRKISEVQGSSLGKLGEIGYHDNPLALIPAHKA